MIINRSTNNFIILNSSFTPSVSFEEVDGKEEGRFRIEEGAVLSNASGDGFVSARTTGEFKEEPVFLGITTSKKFAIQSPTGAAIYTNSERLEKKTDDEDFWTWVEIIDADGGVTTLKDDIVLPEEFVYNGRGGAIRVSFEVYDEGDEEEIFIRVSSSRSYSDEDQESISKLVPVPSSAATDIFDQLAKTEEFVLIGEVVSGTSDDIPDKFSLIKCSDYINTDNSVFPVCIVNPVKRVFTLI